MTNYHVLFIYLLFHTAYPFVPKTNTLIIILILILIQQSIAITITIMIKIMIVGYMYLFLNHEMHQISRKNLAPVTHAEPILCFFDHEFHEFHEWKNLAVTF